MLVQKTTTTSENVFGFVVKETESIINNRLLFEAITTELEEYLLRKGDNADLTKGVLEVLTSLSKQVQEEFDELLGEDTNKKRFLKLLLKIFALLLNTKVTTAEKIKKIIKIALETTVKIWSGQN